MVEESLADKNDFTKAIEQKNIIDNFRSVIKKLSPNYQAVILLKDERGLTFREIARLLGEPLNTVKSKYRRALVALRGL